MIGRKLRLAAANLPIVSLATHRWVVLRGSEVMDYGLTFTAAWSRTRPGQTIERAR